MKYWSGEAPKPRDVVKRREGQVLAVVRGPGRRRGTVKVSWVRACRVRSIRARDLVLLERGPV